MGVYEIDRCPYCGYTLDVRRGVAQDTTIGQPVELCPKCKGKIKTSKTEWANKSPAERMAYFFRVAWWMFGAIALLGFGGGGIITTIITTMILKWETENHIYDFFMIWAVLASLISFLCIIRIFFVVKAEIRESLNRTKVREIS